MRRMGTVKAKEKAHERRPCARYPFYPVTVENNNNNNKCRDIEQCCGSPMTHLVHLDPNDGDHLVVEPLHDAVDGAVQGRFDNKVIVPRQGGTCGTNQHV